MEKGGPNDDWAILGLEPGKTQKKTAVDDVIRKAASISLERPVGKTLKPDYGLSPAEATVTMVTGTSTITGVPPKTTATKVIQIGKKDGDTNNYFIKADGSEYVVTAASWAIDPLITKAMADLIEK